jgi:hypothetical protein
MLTKKLDAVIKILNKEGITTEQEIDELTKELIEKGGQNE